jgi:hypothetical protein
MVAIGFKTGAKLDEANGFLLTGVIRTTESGHRMYVFRWLDKDPPPHPPGARTDALMISVRSRTEARMLADALERLVQQIRLVIS